MKKIITLILFIPLLSFGQDALNDSNIHSTVEDWLVDPSSPQFTDDNNSPYYGHISDWDTSQVTNMQELFRNHNNFNEDISEWNTSNVVTMALMFRDATSFNQPIGSWDVSNVYNFANMFHGASYFNQDIGGLGCR